MTSKSPATPPLPVLFVGHGAPTNALPDTQFARDWAGVSARLGRPKAILSISAHWATRGLGVTAMARPRTIHDFRGFPPALYEMQYPAPGDPALAARIAELLRPLNVVQDEGWGLDHGTWCPLAHIYPAADIPVVQLSIDGERSPAEHVDLARRLAPLRDEEVLILGSGDFVHNLRTLQWRGEPAPYDWAVRFNDWVKAKIAAGDVKALVNYRAHPDAALAAPDWDHFYPALYTAALARPGEPVAFLTDYILGGSASMTSVIIGDIAAA